MRPALVALRAGVSVPCLYFGVQLVAGVPQEGYDFVRDVASELGQPHMRFAWLFNRVVMAQGLVTLVAAFGLWRGLRADGTRAWVAALAGLALALNGVQTLWAGWFPMPDPRHGGHPLFVVGMLALPGLLAAVRWRHAGRGERLYWLASLALLAAVFPFMAGLVPLDRARFDGVLQRTFALAIFPPIGVACALIARARP